MMNLETVKNVVMVIFILIILHIVVFLKMIYLKDMEKYILKVNIHIVEYGKMV